jgi:hypothetical protein
MIQIGSTSVPLLLRDTFTSANRLVWVLSAKSMVGARTVEHALGVIMMEVGVLNVRFCRLFRKLECWKKIRKPVGGVLRGADDGIWIGLLLRL